MCSPLGYSVGHTHPLHTINLSRYLYVSRIIHQQLEPPVGILIMLLLSVTVKHPSTE